MQKNYSKPSAILLEILYVTLSGTGFNCWCISNAGRVKKQNINVPQHLWDAFFGKEQTEPVMPKLKWYQKLWNWIIKKLPGNRASGVKSR